MKNVILLNPPAPATDKDIAELEAAISRRIPDSLKTLLMRSDGGILSCENSMTNAKLPSGAKLELEVQRFYSVAMILEDLKTYAGRVPKNFLPFADTLEGDLFCLNLDERQSGVYFWDHEREEEAYILVDKVPDPAQTNIYPVAPSLETFVDTLAMDES
ncbi:SMI1/KNR4 family protein [Pedosphaera parvula]|uniref:Asp/Glu racemase n=1 Tax=Pedosphaera parvula (strain Ellin514) TaxID=320771 RepID=B9XKA1_PEDPL|nr:SMI1/KNR4 family protein [Pedosphaera parvula]EEF59739.1 Asp/Glu racemase [Pedosphaera parvula Ellin514]